MNKSSQDDDKVFDVLLTQALWENFEEEIAAIPPEAELRKIHTFSRRHQRRMRKILRSSKKRGFINVRFGIAAAVILTILTTIAFSPAARATLTTLIRRLFGQYTQYSPPGMPTSKDNIPPVQFPVNFYEVDYTSVGAFSCYVYANSEGTSITLVHSSDQQVLDVNNESIVQTTIYNDGIAFDRYECTDGSMENTIIWAVGRDRYTLNSSLPVEDMQVIADTFKAE